MGIGRIDNWGPSASRIGYQTNLNDSDGDDPQDDDGSGGGRGGETLRTKEGHGREQEMALEPGRGDAGMHNGTRTVLAGRWDDEQDPNIQ